MRKHICIISVLLVFFSLGTNGQDNSWTLLDCIEHAMQNNISIKQAEINTQYNENIFKQSKLGRYPDLNASSRYTYSFGRALDQTTYEFTDNQQINSISLNAGSSVSLFEGFQKRNTIKQNEINLMASYEDVEKIRNDISLFIASAYLEILFNQELLEAAKNQLDITGQQVERTQKLVDAGKLAKGNVLELKAQYAAEEVNVITAENQLLISKLNLQQILDLDYNPEFSIIIPDLPIPSDSLLLMSVNDVFTSAQGVMPEIKSAELGVNSAELDLAIAKGMRYPSLSLSGNYSSGFSDIREKIVGTDGMGLPVYGKYPFFEQVNDNLSVGIGLSLNIPIFNGGQVNTAIANAQLGLENTKLELVNSENTLYKSIQQAYADALAAVKKYEATEQALISMEESFSYTEKKFEVGLVNTVDYNTSKNQLIQTQSDLLKAKYDFIFKTKILSFYMGESITL